VSKQTRKLVAVLLVSVLMVALAAGTASAQNVISCPPTGDTCYGTPGDDLIEGSLEADTIRALAGDDRVDGFNGNDKIFGGTGNDTLLGAEDSDIVIGGPGDDTIDLVAFDVPTNPEEPAPTDRGRGGAGDDIFLAEDGNKDFINCGPGDDIVASFDATVDVISPTCE
jgi:Ca2+-binding RTX toxin-like protein